MTIAQIILGISILACMGIEILGFLLARRTGRDKVNLRIEMGGAFSGKSPFLDNTLLFVKETFALRSASLERRAVLLRSIGILTAFILAGFVCFFIGITFYGAGSTGRSLTITVGYCCLLVVPFILLIYMIYDYVNDGETLRIAYIEAGRILSEKKEQQVDV